MTDRLRSEWFIPLMDYAEGAANLHLRGILRMPLEALLNDLETDDRNVKGRAPEALAVRLGLLVGLQFKAWRLRSRQTGGAEVDAIMEGAQYVFQRWQIQCKNTRRLTLEDVAKEVGLTFQIKSQVVLLVTTGQVGQEARRLAHSVMETSNLNVVFIDGDDLRLLRSDISRIHSILHSQARHVMSLKAQQIADFVAEADVVEDGDNA